VRAGEGIDLGLQQRTPLAHHPAEFTAGVDLERLVQHEVRQHLRPEPRLVVVDDDRPEQPGIDQFH
jgi:hypothetical protein